MSKIDLVTNDQNFRAKVQTILGHLTAKGLKPMIAESLRTRAQQAEKVKKGYSKTMASYHLPGKDGKARAVDIVDAHVAWNASKRFWLMLGSASLAHSTGWGGLFGLNKKQKQNVVKCINQARDEGWPQKSEAYQVSLGWDPAHIEIRSNWP